MAENEHQPSGKQAMLWRPRALAMHGIHSFSDQVIVSVASFAVMACVGRLGKEEFGIFSLAITSFWLLAGFANALIWTPYTARTAHLKGPERIQFRGDNAAVGLALASLFATLSLLVGGLIALTGFSKSWLATFFFHFAPLVFAFTLREHVRRVFVADFEGHRLVRFDLSVSLTAFSLTWFLYYRGYLDANTALLANAIATLPGLYVVLQQIAKSRSAVAGACRAVGNNWPYGKWLMLVSLAWMLSDGFLRWLLIGAKGQEALGAFAGAFLIVSLVNPVLLAMTSFSRSVASLRLATGSHFALTSATITSIRRLAFFSVLAFIFLYYVGDSTLVMVLGESYSNPGLVSLLAVAVCIEVVTVPAEASIVALEYGRLLSLIASARLLVSIVAGFLLIPAFGDWGLAVSMLCRSMVVLIIYCFVLRHLHRRFSLVAESSSIQKVAVLDEKGARPLEQTEKSKNAAAFL